MGRLWSDLGPIKIPVFLVLLLQSPTIIVYQQKREHGGGHSGQAHRHQGADVHEEEALWKYFQIGQGSAKKKLLYRGARSWARRGPHNKIKCFLWVSRNHNPMLKMGKNFHIGLWSFRAEGLIIKKAFFLTTFLDLDCIKLASFRSLLQHVSYLYEIEMFAR